MRQSQASVPCVHSVRKVLKEMNEERRKKTRVHFKTQVTLKTDKSEIVAEANSKDISIKGMFVNTGKKDSGRDTM